MIDNTQKAPVVTPAMLKALRGVRGCADAEGWASHWPADIALRTLVRYKNAGMLEYGTRHLPGSALTWGAYRVTDAGAAALGALREEE